MKMVKLPGDVRSHRVARDFKQEWEDKELFTEKEIVVYCEHKFFKWPYGAICKSLDIGASRTGEIFRRANMKAKLLLEKTDVLAPDFISDIAVMYANLTLKDCNEDDLNSLLYAVINTTEGEKEGTDYSIFLSALYVWLSDKKEALLGGK